MSLCSSLSKGRIVVGLLAVLAVSLISIPALAQSDSNPKYDLFVGYQWLHPGGNVPTPFGDFNNPTPFNVPDMAEGIRCRLHLQLRSALGSGVRSRSELGEQQLRDYSVGRAALHLAH